MSREELLFSVGLIVRNEENRLPQLHQSLEAFVEAGGEVVLLDTGSTDRTIEMAREYGFKVFVAENSFRKSVKNFRKIIRNHIVAEDQAKFIEIIKGQYPGYGEEGKNVLVDYFDFGAARNELHKYISNRILFQIDGSDVLENFDFAFINGIIKEGKARRFEYTQLYSGVELVISRFYNKEVDIWEGSIHEILTHRDNSIPNFALPKDKLLVVHHYQPKKRTYVAGLLADYLKNQDHTRTLYYLGREFMFMELWRTSISILEKYVRRPDCWVPERSSGYCLIGNCYEQMGREFWPKAFHYYNEGFIAFNGWREPLIRMGRLCMRTDEFQRGLCYAVAALSINRISHMAEATSNYLGTPHEIAYWGYHFTGRRKEACAHWRRAIELEPQHPKYNHDRQFFEKE